VDLTHRAATFRDEVVAIHPVPGDVEQYWIAATRAAAVRAQPDAVLGLTEPQVLAAAMVAETFRLPGPSLAAASTCRDAGLQRTAFADAGVPQPAFLVSVDRQECEEWAAARYPVVVKSPRSLGTSAIALVANPDELNADLDCRIEVGEALVEEYAEGAEYLWVGIVIDQKIIFGCTAAKHPGERPGFVDLGYELPCELPERLAERVHQVVADVIRAVGLWHGMVHVDFRVVGTSPWVLRVSLGAPNAHVMELLSLAYGLDSYSVLLEVVCGGWPDELLAAARSPRPSAIRYLPQQVGLLDHVDGRDELAADRYVVRHIVSAQPGDEIPLVRHAQDRRGYAVFRAPDHPTLHGAIERTLRTFRLVVREPAG
jgi:L-amino acid ligase C-terminal domain 2/ATP-grasp domain